MNELTKVMMEVLEEVQKTVLELVAVDNKACDYVVRVVAPNRKELEFWIDKYNYSEEFEKFVYQLKQENNWYKSMKRISEESKFEQANENHNKRYTVNQVRDFGKFIKKIKQQEEFTKWDIVDKCKQDIKQLQADNELYKLRIEIKNTFFEVIELVLETDERLGTSFIGYLNDIIAYHLIERNKEIFDLNKNEIYNLDKDLDILVKYVRGEI